MLIFILYLIYFISLIIVFFICYFLAGLFSPCNHKDVGFSNILIYLLIASIMALVIIFISVIWIDTSGLSEVELIALNVLLIIVFLLPIIIIVILVFMKEINNDANKCCDNNTNKCCDNNVNDSNKCCDNNVNSTNTTNKCCTNHKDGITI